MKRALLLAAIVLTAVSCGSDEPGPALSAADYGAQGVAICDQMNIDLDQLSAQSSASQNPEEQRDLFIKANTISREAIDELFELSPPASLLAERDALLALVEQRRSLIERSLNGEDTFDQITQVNRDFEERAGVIWPSCTRS